MNATAAYVDAYAEAFASQLLDSLGGNPVTVMADLKGKGRGSSRWSYSRTPSLNADWFQDFDGDRKKIRKALARLKEGKAVNEKWKESRWLLKALEEARAHGWSATIKGKPWIGEIPPEDEWRTVHVQALDLSPSMRGKFCADPKKLCRATFTPKKSHRVYLALPETEYRTIKATAKGLHATPNRYLNHVIQAFHEIEAQASREF